MCKSKIGKELKLDLTVLRSMLSNIIKAVEIEFEDTFNVQVRHSTIGQQLTFDRRVSHTCLTENQSVVAIQSNNNSCQKLT